MHSTRFSSTRSSGSCFEIAASFTPQVACTKQLALPFPRLKRISTELITELLAFLLVRLVHFGVDLVQHRNQSMV